MPARLRGRSQNWSRRQVMPAWLRGRSRNWSRSQVTPAWLRGRSRKRRLNSFWEMRTNVCLQLQLCPQLCDLGLEHGQFLAPDTRNRGDGLVGGLPVR